MTILEEYRKSSMECRLKEEQLSERQKAVDGYFRNHLNLFETEREIEVPLEECSVLPFIKFEKIEIGNGMYLTKNDVEDFANRNNFRYIAPDGKHVYPRISFN